MRRPVWLWPLTITVILLASGTTPQGAALADASPTSRSEKKAERWAQHQQNTIQVHPSDTTFEVPEAWRSDKTFFWPTRNELHKKVARDWIGIRIADGALQLDDCAAQINPDNLNWMRVYVVNAPEEDVLKRIREKGWKALAKIPNRAGGYSGDFQLDPAKEGPWTHVDIPYVLDFGDYNGDGYVSFYLRTVGARQLVMVFGHFYAGHATPDERQNVLKSVAIPQTGS